MSVSIGGGFAPEYQSYAQGYSGANALSTAAIGAGAHGDSAVAPIAQTAAQQGAGRGARQGSGAGTGASGAGVGAHQGGAGVGTGTEKGETVDGKQKNGRCQTCDSRKYQDGSNDPGVSFKSPTNIRPEAAATAVMAHEQEHVTREKQKAGQEGRQVLAQSVSLHLGICPECHRSYVAGGTTRTTTAAAKQQYSANMSTGNSSGSNFATKT